MSRNILSLLVAASVIAASTIVRRAPTPPASFVPGVTWQIVEQDPIDTSGQPFAPTDALVWDLDLFHVINNKEIIPFLKNKNSSITVICYLNVGAIDKGDDDYNEFPAAGIGKPYGPEYPNETWIDTRNLNVINFMKTRIDKAKDAGCQGLDPDNIDGYDVSSTRCTPLLTYTIMASLTHFHPSLQI
jgi:hypothetical protein